MIRTIASAAIAIAAFAAAVRAQEPVREPEGYRTEDYRAPVPMTLAGGRVLTTAETGFRRARGTCVAHHRYARRA